MLLRQVVDFYGHLFVIVFCIHRKGFGASFKMCFSRLSGVPGLAMTNGRLRARG
jgi:hypothetical protein